MLSALPKRLRTAAAAPPPQRLSPLRGTSFGLTRLYSTVGKPVKSEPPHTPRARLFDEHTMSIWASNVVKRGGAPSSAINLIMNRMEEGKARHTAALYNTALDICGHQGMLKDAAQILSKMVARNVRPNERTITSILNAIAEHAMSLPSESVEEGEPADADREVGPPPKATNGLPSEGAFSVQSKEDAVKLAIKLYASWIEHWRACPPCFAFNALLKVLWKAEGGQLLTNVFPISKQGSLTESAATWLPPKPDIVSYSTAILAATSHPTKALELGERYWRRFLESALPVDSGIVMALMVALQKDLYRRGGDRLSKEALDYRRGLFSEALLQLQKQELIPTKATNVALDVALQLGCFQEATRYWQSRCLELLRKMQSFKKCHKVITADTVALAMRIMIKDGKPMDALETLHELIESYGMHISTAVLDEALIAHRRMKAPRQAVKLFEQLVQNAKSVQPSTQTIYHLFLAIRESVEGGQRQQYYGKVMKLLAHSYSELYQRVLQKKSIAKLLGAIQE